MQEYVGKAVPTLGPHKAQFLARSKAVPTLGPHKAQFLARAKAVSKEGTAPVGDFVMLRFDSLEEAERWYHSAEYAAAIPLRQRAANTRLFIIEGEPA